MSARIIASTDTGLIAHSILSGPAPALPTPITRNATATKLRRTPSEENPWCVACRKSMTRSGKAPYGVTKWKCKQCRYTIKALYQPPRPRRNRVRRDLPLGRPMCLTCRRPYYTKGKIAGGEVKWYCGPCGYSVNSRVSEGKGAQPRHYPLNTRPHCATCRHRLFLKAGVWFCRPCGFEISAHCLPPPVIPSENPCCLACRKPMRSNSGKNWKCYSCNTGVIKIVRRPMKPADLLRPWCRVCQEPLACSGQDIWHCNRCDYSIQTHRTKPYPASRARKINGDALLRMCEAAVPRQWDTRDDVVQELLMMILSRQLTPGEITPMKVRQVGRAILKSQSEFANISLETPNREGVRLEERLVG